jgi:acetylglutamate/LysW-gamma-L-alpha-aminoadipate kinase
LNWEGVCRDVASLAEGERVVIVHGASARRDEIAARLNVPTRTVESPSGVTSVYTDEAALDVFLMVYAGLVNKRIVALLQRCGVNAVGLSGVDGALWRAKAKKEILVKEGTKTKLLTGNLTGRVEGVNFELIRLLLDHGYLPVICPPALSHECEIVNTDNDTAAGVMAEYLGVKRMVSLFEAPGLLKNPDDEASLIRHIDMNRIEQFLEYGRGRMKKKILGAKLAINAGVEAIYWGDGRIDRPVLSALQGNGTVIR